MNPFGWRFMGTLFGVLMLPALYHFLKRLFGSTFLCTAGTVLFAFDFMHYVQTRIATIDTYAVFFIILMYDAMLVFIQHDLKTDSFKKLLPPLLLSGIFMGLGIASKWTVAYGAVGLAVLFFGKLIVSYREEKGHAAVQKALLNQSIKLCLWCCLLFIAIPFGIYFTAFLPLTTLPHNRYDVFGRFIAYQTHMYNYHSTLRRPTRLSPRGINGRSISATCGTTAITAPTARATSAPFRCSATRCSSGRACPPPCTRS